MKTIHILTPELIAKIAAGEVVERPASVIKELIENSIDAHAQHIYIDLENGGTTKIRIQDDGDGMSREDASVCYLPHTTSKITNDEDLIAIKSLGFRGEALSSISAVSSMTITTRTRYEEAGTLIELEAGMLTQSGPVGTPVGTEITVESLFYPVPARRKFLKDSTAEFRACTDIVTRYALAYPSIGFTLLHNEKIILNLPLGQKLLERIRDGIHEDIPENSIPIEYESSYGKISGYIGTPQKAGHVRANQYLFVNTRSVSTHDLSRVITESYGSLLEARAHPIFILFLTVPYEQVDVNVHPRKEEVAFAFPDHIKKLFSEGISSGLMSHNLTYTLGESDRFIKDTTMDRHMAGMLKALVTPWNLKSEQDSSEILQIHNLYLVASLPQGMLIVDQHAAHERILFEQFRDMFLTTREHNAQYRLPEPYIFEIQIGEASMLERHRDTFQKIGFDIELFGQSTFKLSKVPDFFRNRDYKQLIREVLQDIEENNLNIYIDKETERTLAYLACRGAIKAGDPLSQDERKNLITKLLEATTPYTCPHGRPTHIIVSTKELDVLFKRK